MIFTKFKTDITDLCRARAKVIHPTITNKIEKLKKRLNEVNRNTTTPENDRMLESIVIKTEMLELERVLFESNRTYARAKHHVHAETICRDWIRTNRAKKPRDTIFSIYNPLADDDTPTHDSNEMAKRQKTITRNCNIKTVTRPPHQTKQKWTESSKTYQHAQPQNRKTNWQNS